MAKTIGQLLQKERKKQGMSVADVAHDTHIHADTIRGLEADDYSVFSSTTYARSFLQLYSRHLEVDADEALHDFDSVSENLSNGKFSYMNSVTDSIEPGETIHPHRPISQNVPYGKDRKQPIPIFLALVVALLVLMIPTFYFIGKKANSMEEAKSILRGVLADKEKDLNSDQQKSIDEQSSTSTENNIGSKSDSLETPDKHRRIQRYPLPIKATPITPENPAAGKTTTAQNRN